MIAFTRFAQPADMHAHAAPHSNDILLQYHHYLHSKQLHMRGTQMMLCTGYGLEAPLAGSPCPGGSSVQIATHNATGIRKNAVVFFHFAYEGEPDPHAISAARDAVRLCFPQGIIDLSEVASCIGRRFEAGTQQIQRGVAVIPDLRHVFGYGKGDGIGRVAASGGVYITSKQPAIRSRSTGLIELGPPIRVVILLPQVLRQ